MLQSDRSFTSHPVLARIRDLIRTKTSYTAVSGSSTSLLWTSIKPLKYLTVLTLSSLVAGSSQTKMVEGCCWKAETVHMWLTPSSMALWRANALWAPVIRIITLRNTQTSEEGCRVFLGFAAADTAVQEHLQKRVNIHLRLFSLSRASSMKRRTKRPPFPNLKRRRSRLRDFRSWFYTLLYLHPESDSQPEKQHRPSIRLSRSALSQTSVIQTDLFCVHDGANPHGEGLFGHFGQVSTEEARVGINGFHRQCFDACPWHQAGSRLVECNVSVWTNA